MRAVGEETGVPLVLNARTDVFLGQIGDPSTRSSMPSSAAARTSMQAPTASSCPASSIRDVITALVQGIDGPVSVLAVPGSPPLAELKRSAWRGSAPAPAPYRAALALARRMAEEAYGAGTLDAMIAAQVAFADAQALFSNQLPSQGQTIARNRGIV